MWIRYREVLKSWNSGSRILSAKRPAPRSSLSEIYFLVKGNNSVAERANFRGVPFCLSHAVRVSCGQRVGAEGRPAAKRAGLLLTPGAKVSLYPKAPTSDGQVRVGRRWHLNASFRQQALSTSKYIMRSLSNSLVIRLCGKLLLNPKRMVSCFSYFILHQGLSIL